MPGVNLLTGCMSAFVFNLADFAKRTPEQMIRVFFELYDPASVREQLLEVFAVYTLADKGELAGRLMTEEAVIALLDQLIFLVEGVARQREERGVACVFCGRV